MPPTDKALAAMKPAHLDELNDLIWPEMDGHGNDLLREIESLVRYLVDHPERLAGEDEVVVKREEMRALRELLSMAERAAMACTETVMITENSERIRRAGNVIDRWLTSLPTI